MRHLSDACLGAFAVLSLLVASCGRGSPVRPQALAPLALSIRWPASASAQQIDSVLVSAFDDGGRRAAGPARAQVDLERRTFAESLAVPFGVPLAIVVEAMGTYFFPNESASEQGVIFFGAARGVTVTPNRPATAEVKLALFVPANLFGAVGTDGFAHLAWSGVPEASRYQVWERSKGGIAEESTADTTTVRCNPGSREIREYRVRAENAFAIGAYTDSIEVVVPPCGENPAPGRAAARL